MAFLKGTKVRVRSSTTNWYVDAVILERADFWDTKSYFWVQYDEAGKTEVTLVLESDLESWNPRDPWACDCGGASVKDHGHSHWCSSNKKY